MGVQMGSTRGSRLGGPRFVLTRYYLFDLSKGNKIYV